MSKSFKVMYEVSVPSERVEDLIVGAIEGGSGYWCGKVEPLNRETNVDFYTQMLDGWKCYDSEMEKWYTVNKPDIEQALQDMAKYHKKHFQDLIVMTDDAITADVFFQLCALKSVVYG